MAQWFVLWIAIIANGVDLAKTASLNQNAPCTYAFSRSSPALDDRQSLVAEEYTSRRQRFTSNRLKPDDCTSDSDHKALTSTSTNDMDQTFVNFNRDSEDSATDARQPRVESIASGRTLTGEKTDGGFGIGLLRRSFRSKLSSSDSSLQTSVAQQGRLKAKPHFLLPTSNEGSQHANDHEPSSTDGIVTPIQSPEDGIGSDDSHNGLPFSANDRQKIEQILSALGKRASLSEENDAKSVRINRRGSSNRHGEEEDDYEDYRQPNGHRWATYFIG